MEADGITPVYSVKFNSNEASSIYYTTDGSTPTTASTEWKPPRARALPLPLHLAPRHDPEVDRPRLQGQHVGGQVAGARARPTRPARVGGSVPATLALTMGAPAQFGAFTPGIAKEYTATTTATVISHRR